MFNTLKGAAEGWRRFKLTAFWTLLKSLWSCRDLTSSCFSTALHLTPVINMQISPSFCQWDGEKCCICWNEWATADLSGCCWRFEAPAAASPPFAEERKRKERNKQNQTRFNQNCDAASVSVNLLIPFWFNFTNYSMCSWDVLSWGKQLSLYVI